MSYFIVILSAALVGLVGGILLSYDAQDVIEARQITNAALQETRAASARAELLAQIILEINNDLCDILKLEKPAEVRILVQPPSQDPIVQMLAQVAIKLDRPAPKNLSNMIKALAE